LTFHFASDICIQDVAVPQGEVKQCTTGHICI
jgi:hypothetical protein